MMTVIRSRFWQITVAAAVCAVLFLSVRPLSAHTRVEIDGYAVIVGWVEEPAIAGERNAILVEVRRISANSDVESPVEGVEATLDIELIYAGSSLRANLNPTDEPGIYTAELVPTVRGQYSVRLFGSIEEVEVNETVSPEEVFPAARLQFPEAEPDVFAIQAQLEELERQQNTSRIVAYAGVLVGLIGTVMGALGVRKAA